MSAFDYLVDAKIGYFLNFQIFVSKSSVTKKIVTKNLATKK